MKFLLLWVVQILVPLGLLAGVVLIVVAARDLLRKDKEKITTTSFWVHFGADDAACGWHHIGLTTTEAKVEVYVDGKVEVFNRVIGPLGIVG